jgi:alpha-galactosidase
VGLTPAMGWNSWNKFACNINETLFKSTADEIISLGLLDAGYNYLNLDDCWMNTNRTADGHLIGNTTRFPSGIKSLGDYIHGKGLKFGIYESAGSETC